MYKDKDRQKEATKERVRRYRERKSVTPNVTPILGGIRPVMVDTEKASKLLLICRSLERHNLLKEVRYGVEGPTFHDIKEVLEFT